MKNEILEKTVKRKEPNPMKFTSPKILAHHQEYDYSQCLFFLWVFGVFIGLAYIFPESALADPFAAVAQKISTTTKGLLKIGAVGCGLVGALLIIQGIFGRLNLRWGVSFVIGAILLASFDYVIDFVTPP